MGERGAFFDKSPIRAMALTDNDNKHQVAIGSSLTSNSVVCAPFPTCHSQISQWLQKARRRPATYTLPSRCNPPSSADGNHPLCLPAAKPAPESRSKCGGGTTAPATSFYRRVTLFSRSTPKKNSTRMLNSASGICRQKRNLCATTDIFPPIKASPLVSLMLALPFRVLSSLIVLARHLIFAYDGLERVARINTRKDSFASASLSRLAWGVY
ncbi:hypothetical protein B0T14DRAFT_308031 [Immersiella caudata]|uniref:Uncharacterized protein n=1 Tax=Immersiella caudata TaxID=314043 RepID=A0AA40BUP3_9PEZI|nr:hypothetical protein B0T14DRAFT_308031 [Immersiella caudata]